MPRSGPHRDDVIDAVACAAVNSRIEREYELSQLPRLVEAAALAGTAVHLDVRFIQHPEFVEVQGALGGQLVLTCQRCLQDVAVATSESLSLRVVQNEADAPAESEQEYVIADPGRLDLRWLAEEQALLAMPLVPMHEPDQCPQVVADEESAPEQRIAQTPFANLRDILKKG